MARKAKGRDGGRGRSQPQPLRFQKLGRAVAGRGCGGLDGRRLVIAFEWLGNPGERGGPASRPLQARIARREEWPAGGNAVGVAEKKRDQYGTNQRSRRCCTLADNEHVLPVIFRPGDGSKAAPCMSAAARPSYFLPRKLLRGHPEFPDGRSFSTRCMETRQHIKRPCLGRTHRVRDSGRSGC